MLPIGGRQRSSVPGVHVFLIGDGRHPSAEIDLARLIAEASIFAEHRRAKHLGRVERRAGQRLVSTLGLERTVSWQHERRRSVGAATYGVGDTNEQPSGAVSGHDCPYPICLFLYVYREEIEIFTILPGHIAKRAYRLIERGNGTLFSHIIKRRCVCVRES